MDRIDVLLKAFIVTFGGFCGYFLGGWDTTLKVLVIMAAIDYITGVFAAGINGELKARLVLKASPRRWCFFFWLQQLLKLMQSWEQIVQFVKQQFSSLSEMSCYLF